MIQNFKGKQNTNGFGRNTQNINRKGRPIDTIAFVTRERIRTGDFTIGTEQVLLYVKEKGYKLSFRELLNLDKLAFARYWYMTGGDMKKYYKVMGIK